ncbi:MAG: alpha-acetolactate decarboxylase [marine bacterium B5-7]|nr:MAG: alpha-acetolactate decarboxylase [marine bacterium B5-7]
MKKALSALFSGLLCCCCPGAHAKPQSLYQVSTISALAKRVYDGDIAYREVMKHGNFGLGTFADLDGEMVALDGHFYRVDTKGRLEHVQPHLIAPFVEVTHFRPMKKQSLSEARSYQALGDALRPLFSNANMPYAIRIDGEFPLIQLRNVCKQKKPYPSLVEVSKTQATFELKNVKGTLVGFWFPQYWAGIGVPGFHFHFVTDKRDLGGHVSELHLNHGQLQLNMIDKIDVQLPHHATFANAHLSDEKCQAELKKAEGGHRER